MTLSPNIAIHTQGLGKRYRNIVALDALDLTVPRNTICGFLGPNGAGKTTTIKLLLGLTRPTTGTASIFEHDIVGDSIAIRDRVGYLSQEPRFYVHMTARQTLAFTLRFFFEKNPAAFEQRIEETLELVGLADKADRPIKTFSGGERQRLGIAQAQINHPDLLILDEPAANLDPMGRRDVLAVMDRLRQHATVFYSTHILDDVQRVSDNVVILNHGRLIAEGTIEDLTSGQGDTTYTVSLKGDANGAVNRLNTQGWVSGVESAGHNGLTKLQVRVNDPAAADNLMLRLLLEDRSLVVREFGRKQANLEEAFLSIVEGDNHDN